MAAPEFGQDVKAACQRALHSARSEEEEEDIKDMLADSTNEGQVRAKVAYLMYGGTDRKDPFETAEMIHQIVRNNELGFTEDPETRAAQYELLKHVSASIGSYIDDCEAAKAVPGKR